MLAVSSIKLLKAEILNRTPLALYVLSFFLPWVQDEFVKTDFVNKGFVFVWGLRCLTYSGATLVSDELFLWYQFLRWGDLLGSIVDTIKFTSFIASLAFAVLAIFKGRRMHVISAILALTSAMTFMAYLPLFGTQHYPSVTITTFPSVGMVTCILGVTFSALIGADKLAVATPLKQAPYVPPTEISKYTDLLDKLEERYRKGEVSSKIYDNLRKEYEEKIRSAQKERIKE